jgi:hypothetical protein
MIGLAKIIGMIITVAGVVFLLHPKSAKKLLGFWEEGKRVYGLAAIRLVVGAILLLAARECMVPWLVVVFGALAVIGGVVILAFGVENSKGIIAHWKAKPDNFFRKISFIPLVMGLLLLWAI